MAYGGQFLKITWQFTVKSSDEIADTSLNYTSAPGWTGAVAALAELDDTDLADMRQAYVTEMMDLDHISWADYSVLNSIKVAAISTAGEYLTDPLVAETDTPSDGTAVGVLPQSTVVLSLRSGFTLGKGNYGRMYLPHTTLGRDALRQRYEHGGDRRGRCRLPQQRVRDAQRGPHGDGLPGHHEPGCGHAVEGCDPGGRRERDRHAAPSPEPAAGDVRVRIAGVEVQRPAAGAVTRLGDTEAGLCYRSGSAASSWSAIEGSGSGGNPRGFCQLRDSQLSPCT